MISESPVTDEGRDEKCQTKRQNKMGAKESFTLLLRLDNNEAKH